MITTEQQLSVLSAEVLRDLGRNEGAGRAVRKMAVKLLIEKKHPFANHPDFRELRAEIAEEADAHAEVESIIGQVKEFTPEDLIDKTDVPGPFKASFTTKNL